MATIQKFEDINAWIQARDLAQQIYKICNTGQFSKDYSLRDQIRRSSGSVMDNIAEGYERGSKKEFIQFLFIAKGSASEVRSQLYRALDQKYVNKVVFDRLYQHAFDIAKMIKGLINYLDKTELKGEKYRNSK